MNFLRQFRDYAAEIRSQLLRQPPRTAGEAYAQMDAPDEILDKFDRGEDILDHCDFNQVVQTPCQHTFVLVQLVTSEPTKFANQWWQCSRCSEIRPKI